MSYMNGTSMLDEMLNQMSDDIPGTAFDLSKGEPGMTLQRFDRGVWGDYLVKGQRVLSPVDIEALPPGKYRLV